MNDRITVATFSITILAPKETPREIRVRTVSNLPVLLEASEDDLTELLPEGWQVVIQRT
jgi:hypothetical protein